MFNNEAIETPYRIGEHPNYNRGVGCGWDYMNGGGGQKDNLI